MDEKQIGIKIKTTLVGSSTKQLKDYANQLSRIRAFSKGLDKGALKQINQTSDGLDGSARALEQIEKNTRRAFNLEGITSYLRMAKGLVTTLGKLTSKSAEYTENINLYQVAFNGATEEADAFVNKLTEMYGLDESWLTRTTGIFKQLSNAMSLGVEEGTKLSKLMTQMSIDISSLYNIDIERASSVLQSSLAGQTKPIRGATGADITQNTLQMTLDNMGIEKAVTNLSFAEKRLLIIISLTQQLNQATNDFGKTIESPANQMRILSEQWERLSRSVGNIFLPVLAKVLPYLNAVMMVLTEIINIVASFFGYKLEDYDFGVAGTADSVLELEDALNGAGESAKKLKSGLRGFDKLNVITTPKGSESGSGGGIDPEIMDAFNKAFDEYNSKLKDVKMRANEIRDAMLEWLGITDGSYKNLKRIATVLGVIAGLKIVKGIQGLVTGTSRLGKLLGTGGLYATLTKLLQPIKVLGAKDGLKYIFLSAISPITKLAGALGMSLGTFGLVTGAIVALIGAFVSGYKNNEEFRESVENLVETLKSNLTPVFESIIGILQMLWKEILVPIWDEILQPLVKLLITSLVPVLKMCVDVLQILLDKITKPLVPYLQQIGGVFLITIIAGIKTIITIVGKVIEVVTFLLDNVLTPLFGWLTEAFEIIATWIGNKIVSKIETISSVLKNLWKNWLEPIYIFLKASIMLVIYEIGNAFDKLIGIWDSVKKKFKEVFEDYVKPVVDKIKKAIDDLKQSWENFKNKWKLPDLKVPKLPKIKLGITYDVNVGKAKTAVYKALGLDGWPHLNFQAYAQGGMPPVGQLFVANERGPELVGHIGGQSFVANQNQMMDLLDKKIGNGNGMNNATFIIQVGSKEVARTVLNDLQDMAKSNGKPITIQG